MKIRVGHPYSHKGGPLPDGTYYAWCGDRHELAVVRSSPGAETRRAVSRGEVELAFVHEAPVLVVLARIAGLDGWREAPFCWHLLPRSERHVPRRLRDGESALLDVVLVRAEDGIVDAAGWITLDPAFSWVLQRAIREEAARSWDPVVFHRAFETLRTRYPSPELLLELAVPCSRTRIEGREPPTLDPVVRADGVAGGGETWDGSSRDDPGVAPPGEAPGPDDSAVFGSPEPGQGC